jgi:hypothetical protein
MFEETPVRSVVKALPWRGDVKSECGLHGPMLPTTELTHEAS